MSTDEPQRRRISTVAAAIMVVAIGVVVVYFGLGMLNMGLYAFTQGEVLLGIVSVLFGTALAVGPVVVLVSQLRALRRDRGRRSTDRS
jgi:hypothetical protein